MRPRERVLMALENKEPDRVPIDLGGTGASSVHIIAYKNLTKFLGLNLKGNVVDKIQQIVGPDEEILRKFNVDFRQVSMKPPKSWKYREYVDDFGRRYFVDEWGIKWGENPYYWDMIDHPLKDATIKDLEEYPWPNPRDPSRTEELEKEVRTLYEATDFAIVAGVPVFGGLFEMAWYLRGFQKFAVDMVIRPEFANNLLDKLLELYIEFYDEYLSIVGEYVQVTEWSDDYGMQTGPLLSPNLFKKYFKPRDKKFFDFLKSKTDAKIFLHSCGSVYPFIEDLIEIGVDILNPIQPLAINMDHARLKRQFGTKLSFHGGLDVQRVLPYGTPEVVREEVKKVIKNMAPGGGYIFAAAHNIQADVPPENIETMFEAAIEYGRYPLKT